MDSEWKKMAAAIGRNLKERRRTVWPKDTQRDVAARLGVGVAAYSRMERGDARVAFRHYLVAASRLGCEGQFSELFARPDRKPGELINSLLREYEQQHRQADHPQGDATDEWVRLA